MSGVESGREGGRLAGDGPAVVRSPVSDRSVAGRGAPQPPQKRLTAMLSCWQTGQVQSEVTGRRGGG